MLNDFYEMPKDRLLQNAADFLEDQSEGWLQRIREILDKLGLAVRVVRVDLNRPLNIPTPSIWVGDDGFSKLITKKCSVT